MRSALLLLISAACLLGGAALPAQAAADPAARTVCRLSDPRIDEASGIALGMASPGILYVQNDSGDTNRIFALNARTCRTAATITVRGATNVDWEDIAVARDASGTPSIWIADIGDNKQNRNDVAVYRVAEPRIDDDVRNTTRTVDVAETWRLRYPAGIADAESLAVAPRGRAYLVTKSPVGRSYVFRLPDRGGSGVQVLRKIGKLQLTPVGESPLGIPGALAATGAAFSPDATKFVLRTYSGAFLWTVRDGDVAGALRGPPVTEALPRQRQGEGITFDGDRLLLDSEGAGTPVLSVARPQAEASSPAGTSASRSPSASASASGTSGKNGGGGSWLPGIIVLSLAVLGAIGWWTAQRTGSARGHDR